MKSPWLGLALVVAGFVFALAVYPSLPAEVPTRWSTSGEVTGWMPRTAGALLLPGVALGVWLLGWILPRIDPWKAHYERFIETYWLLINFIVFFTVLIEVVVLGVALGWPIDVNRVVPVGVGMLLVVIGNFLPRIRPNWWMGIRTPWTLTSERVWVKTHRVGGKSLVVGGVLMMATVLLPPSLREASMVAVSLGAALVPAVYSYLLWRRERDTGLPSEGTAA